MIAALSYRSEERQPTGNWLSGPGIEVLWTAAIALLSVTVGYELLPGFIRMVGKSGRIESVEWALFLALGTGFPAAAAAAGWLAVRIAPSRAAAASAIAGVVVAFLVARFFWIMGPAAFFISALFAVLVLAVAVRSSGDSLSRLRPSWTAAVMLVLTAVWEAVFRIASWTDAAGWTTQSVRTPILTVLMAAAATVTIVTPINVSRETPVRRFRISWMDLPAILVFLVLSFRTTPIVEFYHWGFWVGPIESLHQGGWLLWDVPSQYGFLSILIPSLLPTSNAWQSLYLFQGALYAVTAIAIYVAIAALHPGIVSRLVALAFTATAFFFRPRTFPLILPAQMTPAGGPMRFFWCYVILAVLVWKYRRRERVSDVRFAIVGTVVWVASVAWSAESAIYTTVAWGGAYTVFLLQRFFAMRALNKKTTGSSVRHLLGGIALPVVAIVAAAALVTLAYRAFDGHGPDWMNYYEYALLFSGGYSALPVEVIGAVWYLVVLFIVVSAVVVRFLVRDPSNPRLFVAVGAWGTVWGISSYFVSRSHPVNLLSLVPLLVFSVAIVLHLLQSTTSDRWSGLLAMVAVPLVAMPTVLTLAHAGFPTLLFHQQTGMSNLTAQVPPMDPSLAQLVRTAGMRASDPVFFVSDGRYVMPRWPELDRGRAKTNALAWVPKNYEVISTLSEARRNTYITRFQRRVRIGGWLVQKKSDINPAYESVVALIEKSYTPIATFENDQWLAIRYEPKARQ